MSTGFILKDKRDKQFLAEKEITFWIFKTPSVPQHSASSDEDMMMKGPPLPISKGQPVTYVVSAGT